jgi:hypothetical protein
MHRIPKTAPPRQFWCSDPCLDAIIKKTLDDKQAMAKASQKMQGAKHRQAKQKLKEDSLPKQVSLTQADFNILVRMIDECADLPCISCGRHDWEIDEKPTGGKWDCGHFITVGAHPELRFVFINAGRQCKSCNGGSGRFTRKNRTVSEEYKERLQARIGTDLVAWLERDDHPAAKYQAVELIVFRKILTAEQRFITKHCKPSREWRALPTDFRTWDFYQVALNEHLQSKAD